MALGTALALGACSTPGPTPAGQSTVSATPSATESTTGKDGTVEPLDANATDTDLIDQLEASLASFTEHQGGDWTFKDGAPFVADGDYPAYRAVPCTTDGDYEGDADGERFSLNLLGPGVEDPEAALDLARGWAADHGWQEANTGQGSQADAGGRFIALDGDGVPKIVLDVSQEQSRLVGESPCSTHRSVKTHDQERPKWTSPGNRFDTDEPATAPTPDPSSTRLGISG